ncbi:TPA: hypothetical protein ACUKKL_004957 [Escherichia coli]|uniref:hypothetical protein n=1 Tax=Escherichia coli TaxID=562 RepID=UPI001F42815C|nr:hypothetical protein [Escherichia coli]MDC9083130.1 hypothetical protein [Escherichia coli]MDL6773301.1 hypothetical protein [Escherichia coli]WNU67752.1 hypothetical protein RS166_04815 [Escherichia coli]
MLTLQVHWLAEKPDGKGSRSPFAIFPVRTVLPDTLIHEPDWHGGQCQSGLWLGGNKVNYSACKWYEATSAHFIGGRSGGSIYYKPIQCPAGYVMTGTRMYGIGDGVDEEHVDAYCCPFG